jgi:hypothetical protein
MTGEWKYGSVWRIPSRIYPPLQAAAHRAWRLVPTPRAHFTQALTRGPRTRPSVSTGRRSGGPVVWKRNVLHIPYARRPVGSGIVVMIASVPTTSAVQ